MVDCYIMKLWDIKVGHIEKYCCEWNKGIFVVVNKSSI